MTARASDRFIPWYIVLFFAAQAALYAWFLHIAHDSYPGVVTEKAYDKGLKYNDIIASSEQQAQLGWTSSITTSYTATGAAQVKFSLKDAAGKPVTNARVAVWFVRPVKSGMDVQLDMKPSGDGVFTAETGLPARGLWELRVRAESGGKSYQASRKVSF
ncbi:MAG: hypothetical protein EPN97_10275 [Alphaproteobacteria bacterium]|nr:MAG: hypothetical protein EPN97_10275 [Alphaproteobacteria bacterium]